MILGKTHLICEDVSKQSPFTLYPDLGLVAANAGVFRFFLLNLTNIYIF